VAAYSGSAFPDQYNHVVFFGDYLRHDIEAVSFDPTYSTEISDTIFDSNAGTIADLVEGPDGSLYYVGVYEGKFYRISATGPFAPTAAASAVPNAGSAPLQVQFSSAGSSEPYGLPLSYSWDFGDGAPTDTSANPSHQYAASGTYTATLTVAHGGQSATATTNVVVGQSPPAASIDTPALNAMYNGGDTISFSGSATDPNQVGNPPLPASAYTWKADFISNGVAQPFYLHQVASPFFGPVTGVTSGTFRIPADNSNTPGSFYRVTLTVVNSGGIATVVTRDINPNLTNLTVSSNVAGGGFFVDGAWYKSTYSAQDVVGVQHVLIGAPLQSIGGQRYRLSGWADGNALSDSFTSAAGPNNFTVNYDPVQNAVPAGWQSADIGAPILAGTADYSSSTHSFFIDGAGIDVYKTNDQFHYVYQTLNGDGNIVARVRYQTNSDPNAKAGVMIKQSPSSGSAYVDALVTPDVSPNTPNVNGVNCVFPATAPGAGCDGPLPPVTPLHGAGIRMQYLPGGSIRVTSDTALAGFTAPNKWLKLQRTGNNFTSWYSTDGSHWTQIGATAVTMNGPVTIGLFTTSRNVGQFSSTAFDNVQVTGGGPPPPPGLPAPWADTDVGNPQVAGSASYSSGVFTVHGAGADIFGSNDQFNYVYQPDSGNATLIARVTSQTNTSSNAKAGIIFKQSTTAGSNYILIAQGPTYTKIQWDFNGSMGTTALTLPNAWMKLTRVGSTFTAFISGDGTSWTQVISKTLPISGTATAGLYVCSHNPTVIGTATFDNVSFSPGP
jgi:PKD repeat protein